MGFYELEKPKVASELGYGPPAATIYLSKKKGFIVYTKVILSCIIKKENK